ncbi:MAG: hypothetical protein LUG16_08220, partial [Candidatus Gastranaerophilales bacterium]|nr:hypothetical protein [Candidatus Gastranaerophilales bacterium]
DMSEINSINDAISYVNSYLSDNGIDKQISRSDIVSIFEENCGDNLTMSVDDFTEAFTEEFGIDGNDYWEDYNAFATLSEYLADNDEIDTDVIYGDKFSVDQIKMSSDQAYYSDTNYVNNENYTPTISTNSSYGIDFSGTNAESESLEELQSERTTVASNLATAQNDLREAQTHDSNLIIAKENVQSTKESYDKACDDLAEADDEFKQLNEQKTDIDNQISDQNDVISTCKTQIIDTKEVITKCNTELSKLTAPNESDYITKGPNGQNSGYDYAGLAQATKVYEQTKADLESQLKTAEENLAQMQEQLIQEENALTQLEEDAAKIDTQISDYVNNASGELADAVKTALYEYNTAQSALKTAETANDTRAGQLQQTVNEYQQQLQDIDAAIIRAEKREQVISNDDITKDTAESASSTGLQDWKREFNYDSDDPSEVPASAQSILFDKSDSLKEMGIDISEYELISAGTYMRYNPDTKSNEYLAVTRGSGDNQVNIIHTINAKDSAAYANGNDDDANAEKKYSSYSETFNLKNL